MVLLWTGGCESAAKRQVDQTIRRLGKIEPVPDINIPVPQVYKTPPEIVEQTVGGSTEYKLFYFCQYHTSDELKKILHEQFAVRIFNEKGKSTTVQDYTVTSNPATNQLIVRCPLREDIDAVLDVLQRADVPPIQVRIDCIISEIYADKTLDWETSVLIEELFGEQFWAGPGARPFGESVSELLKELESKTGVLPAFPGASLRDLARSRMGLQMGYWKTKRYMALLDILESHGYLKILMNPTLEVVNGKTAIVSSSQKVPLQQTFLHSAQSEFYTVKTEYEDVVDSLEITPHVFADGYIGLETKIILGSKLTPEGVKQLPIITKKEIENKENRIRQGESLVIGGIRKTEKRDVVRGIPGLKDVPWLGVLFSGRDFEERVVETMFILTPTISTGGIPNQEMIEKLRKKHETPSSAGDLDLLGSKARQKEQERKAQEAEQARIEAEAQKTQARHTIREAQEQVRKAEAEALRARDELNRVIAEAEKIKAEAEAKAKAAEEARATAEKATKDAAKTKTEAEKLAEEAKKAKIEAEKAKAAAEKARAQAEAKAKAAEQARKEAEAGKKAGPEAEKDAERKSAPEKNSEKGQAKAASEEPKQEGEKPGAKPGKAEANKAK